MSCKHFIIGFCQDVISTSALLVDTIDELNGSGVVIEGILVKDGIIDGRDISVDGSNLDSHIADMSNPHNVTSTQVGLGPLDTPTFKNVISDDPTLSTHLATKSYVDSVVGGSGVFGTEPHFNSNLSPLITTNTISLGGYVEYLKLTTGVIPIGIYRVGWNFDWSNDSGGGRDLVTKVTVDTITNAKTRNGICSNTSGFDADEGAIAGSGNDQRLTYSGFFNITFVSAVAHDIRIEFTRGDSGSGSGPVTLSDAHLELWRVG